MNSRPCKTCGHVQEHVIAFYGETCREAKCFCVWYESITNLEYLEWLYNGRKLPL